MTSRLKQRRARIRAEYGFDFPDDFYHFWEFVNRLSPLDPLHALDQALDLVLVGPFEILAGRFDGRVPRHSLLLHWRYFADPPEFFTVLAGGGDGLHFGYFLDDPDTGDGCLSSYYAHDAYELSTDGDTLFEAVRLHLEYAQVDCDLDSEYDLEEEATSGAMRDAYGDLRDRLMKYATNDRPETGADYTDLYAGVSRRNDRILAETAEQMGIVAPAHLYRPLSVSDKRLWRQLSRKKFDPTALGEEARQALADGFSATALKLGKELWPFGDKARAEAAAQLLDAAYEALGRQTLRRVLQIHLANRELPSVDILDDERSDLKE
jgi:hypothetical protein